MDSINQSHFEKLGAKDKDVQLDAFQNILEATKEEVDWAYEVWDQLKEWLTDADNHKRSRAAQLLSSLTVSDHNGCSMIFQRYGERQKIKNLLQPDIVCNRFGKSA